MKKLKETLSLIASIAGGIIVILGIGFAIIYASNVSVHVTPYGEKYHSSGCFYLDDAAYLTTYDTYIEAEAHGYDDCSRCNVNRGMTYIKLKLNIIE